jgi:hypothetical protein
MALAHYDKAGLALNGENAQGLSFTSQSQQTRFSKDSHTIDTKSTSFRQVLPTMWQEVVRGAGVPTGNRPNLKVQMDPHGWGARLALLTVPFCSTCLAVLKLHDRGMQNSVTFIRE